jgi:hypothetical protein
MVTIKLHLNSVIYTKNARSCTIDPKDFYLNTPMGRLEFMHMKLSDLPPKFVNLYDLEQMANNNGIIFVKIQKGMYGLPQAGILAQNLLKKWQNLHGYHKSKITLHLLEHNWQPISSTFCVNNFSIKYVGWEYADHLAKILNKYCKCSINLEETRYLGMNMDWDYDGRRVHVSMLNYVSEALMPFQHQAPDKP